MRGKMERAWIVTCVACGWEQTFRGQSGKPRQSDAERWAREKGWSKTRAGWKCDVCNLRLQLRSAARVRQ